MNYHLHFPCSLLSSFAAQPIIPYAVTFPTPAWTVPTRKSMFWGFFVKERPELGSFEADNSDDI